MTHLPLTWDCKYFTHNTCRNIACGGEIKKPCNILLFITEENIQGKMEIIQHLWVGVFAANTVKFVCYTDSLWFYISALLQIFMWHC